jgi:hypothetical protein
MAFSLTAKWNEGYCAPVRIAGRTELDEDMMDDLLKQLRRAPSSDLLEGFDDRVMTSLAMRKREVSGAQRFMAFAAMVSLGGGAFAGMTMGEPAQAAHPLSPFAPATALAPSALLDPR